MTLAEWLEWDTVSCYTVYIVLLPFYIYGFKTWYQWRNHCLFRLRYSYPEGLFLIIVALLLVHSTLLRDVLKNLNLYPASNQRIFTAVSLSLISMIQGIIYYRATLTFLAFQQHQSRLYQMGISSSTYSIKANEFNATSPKKHYISRLLLIVYVIVSFSILILRLLATSATLLITNVLLTFNLVVAVFIYIIVKKNRVRELMGCLLETYITFGMTVLSIPLPFLISDDDAKQFAAYIMYHLWALSTLYFTIYFMTHKTSGVPTSLNDEFESHEAPEHGVTLQSVHSLSNHTDDEIKAGIKEIEQDIQMPLTKFLRNQKDCDIFSKYLAFCFCLENLMFVQRVCVFRWLVIDRMNVDHKGTPSPHVAQDSFYGLKFEFAIKMYKEYNELMGKEKNETMENQFKRDRVGLWKICSGIYNEFITNDAMNQVNIPHLTRIALECKFNNDEIPRYFESYHDFLDVFHDATDHIWRLLQTVYEFRFATYLKRRIS